jgi:hypothetical protein
VVDQPLHPFGEMWGETASPVGLFLQAVVEDVEQLGIGVVVAERLPRGRDRCGCGADQSD